MAYHPMKLKRPWRYHWPSVNLDTTDLVFTELVNAMKPLCRRRRQTVADENDPLRPAAFAAFCLGANRVLRLLQRDQLSVVLFDADLLQSSAIRDVVASLAVGNGVHCVRLHGLSDRLASQLNFRTLAAVGIRRDCHCSFESLLALLKSRLPCVALADTSSTTNALLKAPRCVYFSGTKRSGAEKRK